MALPSQSLDETRRHRLRIQGSIDPEDQSATPASLEGRYDGSSETFSAVLWTGDARAAVATLAAEWDAETPNNPAGLDRPVVLLTIAADTIADLTPGRYRVHVLLNPGTDNTLVLSDTIELTAAPGAAGALAVYCTLDDLLTEYAPIRQLMADDASVETDFAEQRHWAFNEVNRNALARARRAIEEQKSRHRPVLCVDPIRPTTGVDAGPWWGDSIYPDTDVNAQLATVAGYLADSKMMTGDTDLSGGRVKMLAVYYALHKIYAGQVDADGKAGYRERAREYLGRARRALAGTTFYLDSTGSGTPDYQLDP